MKGIKKRVDENRKIHLAFISRDWEVEWWNW